MTEGRAEIKMNVLLMDVSDLRCLRCHWTFVFKDAPD